ncbi:MAG: hypothetical protein KDA99_14895 [Planctomycetales bacterium]|nr:hypothetical protein [Planctomycetales bacterium]
MTPFYQADPLITNSFGDSSTSFTAYGSTGGPSISGAVGSSILLGQIQLHMPSSAAMGDTTTLRLSDPSSFSDWGAGSSGATFDDLLFPSSITITSVPEANVLPGKSPFQLTRESKIARCTRRASSGCNTGRPAPYRFRY